MAILNYFPRNIGDLTAIQLDAARVAEGFLRTSFDWDTSTNIPCIIGPLREGKELGLGGWELRKKCRVRVRIENLPGDDRPQANHNITIHLSEDDTDGTKLRILWVENTNGAILEMECVDTNHP